MSARTYTNLLGLTVNMYDCTPCPKCGNTYRVPYRRDGELICECDECNFKEPWTAENGRPDDSESDHA